MKGGVPLNSSKKHTLIDSVAAALVVSVVVSVVAATVASKLSNTKVGSVVGIADEQTVYIDPQSEAIVSIVRGGQIVKEVQIVPQTH
jgi:hypothetical protein